MKNTFGNAVSVTLFGESHGPAVGAVLDGIAPGIPVDESYMASRLRARHPADAAATARHEPDRPVIVSGVYRGRTTGTPLTVLIENRDADRTAYADTDRFPRPGHADYPAAERYHGAADLSGGGHFSGRLTAALVAVGAIAETALSDLGIAIGTHIASLGPCTDRPFGDLRADIAALSGEGLGVLDANAADAMRAALAEAAAAHDSLGGVLETAVTGLPVGLGEPWFDTVEGLLAHALFSIPAVKGVSFGDGFALAARRGSEVSDNYHAAPDGRIVTTADHNGGVLGGLTTGMPLLFSCAVKPTPSHGLPQTTVDRMTHTDVPLTVTGRHDPAVVHRARAVVDAVTALTLCDLLAGRYGTDYLGGGRS